MGTCSCLSRPSPLYLTSVALAFLSFTAVDFTKCCKAPAESVRSKLYSNPPSDRRKRDGQPKIVAVTSTATSSPNNSDLAEDQSSGRLLWSLLKSSPSLLSQLTHPTLSFYPFKFPHNMMCHLTTKHMNSLILRRLM